MVDVNATRFHLLLGQDDWGFAERSPREPADLEWDAARHEVTLRARGFGFISGRGDSAPRPSDRRGAARDRFGNWYWIDPAEGAVLVRSAGTDTIEAFWPAPTSPAQGSAGAFAPSAPEAARAWRLRGLAVTVGHHLIVGAHDPVGGESALLVFDLHGRGPPFEARWPHELALDVWDLSPTEEGGLWVLDQTHRRYWRLDAQLRIVRRDRAPAVGAGRFAPSAPTAADDSVEPRRAVTVDDSFPAGADRPIAIEAVDDAHVLVLDQGEFSSALALHRLTRDAAGATQSAVVMQMTVDSFRARFEGAALPLHLHDVAFLPNPCGGGGEVYLVAGTGNQALRATLSLDAPRFEPAPDYFPMRLHRGRALVRAERSVYYDSGDRWVALVQQRRPRFETEGALTTAVLDGREPGCVWHRLCLDATIPSGASVVVESRAADERAALEALAWEAEAPATYRRSDGAELPFVARGTRQGEGTWELLLQRAAGRFLQLRFTLRGDGVRSPALSAARVWYPRFSYRDRYLPAHYRERDDAGGGFLERFLANLEGILTPIEGRIAAAQILFDLRSAPPDTLDWLGSWFGVVLDPAWDDARRRLFLRHAAAFFQMRGTPRGLRTAVALATADCVDERLFTAQDDARLGTFGVRIVEHFRTREYPALALREAAAEVDAITVVAPGAGWRPAQGLGELLLRYGRFLGRWREGAPPPDDGPGAGGAAPPDTFPTHAPTGSAAAPWREFVRARLGMADLAAGVDRDGWGVFLRRRYRTLEAVAAAHGAVVASASRFEDVPYPDPLPNNPRVLEDWFRYETVVRPMRRTAHRFTVLVPVRADAAGDDAALQQKLRVAARVVALEKPAHTTYDVRLYWAMFRAGFARLGYDTVVDLGGRAPDLLPGAVVGRAGLAQAHLVGGIAPSRRDRVVVGHDVLDGTQASAEETSA